MSGRNDRSGLLMLELLLAVGIFSFCAAVCVGLFVKADAISRESADLDWAVSEAQNVAELFKFTGGSVEETAALAGGWMEGNTLRIAYDGDRVRLPSADGASYTLELAETSADAGVTEATVTVWGQEEAPILRWSIAAWEAAS
jgi:hypothetical protein